MLNRSFIDSERISILAAYEAFNARDIDTALSLMHPDVEWPNGMEGGTVHGREAVREYWTRQWAMINPVVEPVDFDKADNGTVNVTVHQVVKDMAGNLLHDRTIHHVYAFKDGLINTMEIKDNENDV